MHSDPNYMHIQAHLQDLERKFASSRTVGERRRLRDMPLVGMLTVVAMTSGGLLFTGLTGF